MKKIRSLVYLGVSLQRIIRKAYLQFFSLLKNNKEITKKQLKNNFFKKVLNRKGKIKKIVHWMINTGKINITQRGFYRWKIKTFNSYAEKIEMYLNKDKFSVFRSIWNMLNSHRLRKIQKRYIFWKKYSKSLSKFPCKVNKKNKVYIRFLQLHFSNNLLQNFQLFRLKTLGLIRNSHSKSPWLLLNLIFSRQIQFFFEKWKNHECVVNQVCEEFYTESEKVVKSFYVIKKPCVRLEYEDVKTNYPSFRAVYRNLTHFLRRYIKKYFYLWFNNMEKIKLNDEIITKFMLKERKELMFYRLLGEDKKKIKILVTYFSTIYKKKIVLRKNCLVQWSQRSFDYSMKLIKLESIYFKIRIDLEKLKNFFQILKGNVAYFNNFIDI